ncbi:type II toxin-antitoxin system PemK/MazF family toxin [Phyllobacterium zundukense]|jgi:mRNA interferase MazF|uniref:Type II toxin-antitoxin system PemK/MazF family toxin n=1 Tax=Phyllobacterium zundukense TaxID=1867719 RepID=A0ACD4D0C7_9HYPH|nr:type II toxin-antitoxin system PemK/MazF family toxin [Phyllobacterium zundukense]UXN59348.1 type II toxin-antitoxin system PemK/MazF family toxin [Phyllobacterium zundukense]
MKRGDLVTIVVNGDYGKPRPAFVVQSDAFELLPSVTVLQLTSDVHDEHLARITINPTVENGLRERSQVMIDRAMTVPRTKVGRVFGHLDSETIANINKAIARFLALETEV